MRALFIGNSFTARNDVPALVARLAGSRGKRLEHRLISAGGASLRMHWNRGEAQDAIRAGPWDYVVLQEQSTLPVKNARRMHENVRLFDEAIRGAGARTALYLTWARRHAPETQRAITEAYTTIGAELGAVVVPAGVAWERLLARDDHPVLHDADGSHPTLAGSYPAACTFHGTLFDERPAAGDVPGLTRAEEELLRESAWATVAELAAGSRGGT
jgi:hypothetical protein